MAFPADPLDLVAELYVEDRWVDISGDVREASGVTIRRGSLSEDRVVPPARCTLTLDDRGLRYSPRNPLSTNYGLLGRNTPLRISLRRAADDFTGRTVSNGWGTSGDGHAWSTGTSVADYAVSGGAGTHTIQTAVTNRISYLGAEVHRDVDVYAVVDLVPTNITGGDLEPINLVVRGISTTDYYLVRVVISSAEVVTVKLMYVDGTTFSDTVTVPLIYTGQQLAVRTQVEGQQWRAKVWALDTTDPDSNGEPYDWHVSARITHDPRTGWVGVRSGVGSGNTNVPVVFSYTAFEVRTARYAGEVSAWPPRWDTSAQDRTVPIEAAGILRRLGQGNAALLSTLRRSIPTLPSLVAYWPCEDGRDATYLASAIEGGEPMTISGDYTLASFDGFAASEAIPTIEQAIWRGRVPGYSGTGVVQLRFLLAVPDTGAVDQALIARVHTTGSIGHADLYYTTGGGLRLIVYARGTVVLDSTSAFSLDGQLVRVSLELVRGGVDVNWLLSVLAVGSTTGGFTSGTIVGQALDGAVEVDFSLNGDLQGTAIGHVTVESVQSTLFDLWEELYAFTGETATARLTRLCAELDVPLAITGSEDSTALMGPQRPGEFLDLLRECVDVDQGVLGESRGTASLVYRTRKSMYDQSPIVTVDYSAGELGVPFEPVDDDLGTRNDVTVQRTGGSTAQAVLESGRMSVLDPAEGGAGRYATKIEANTATDEQLQYLADWLLALGTVDGQRYPSIVLDLARIAGNATLAAGALSLDSGDRVLLTELADLGIYDDVSLLATGYAETLRSYAHRLTVGCVPADPYRVLTWNSTTYGRYDSGSTTLAAGITSSATSLSLATTANELWTTTAGHFPLEIRIDGEVIRLSAISGSSSPQTATVDTGGRAVNGVSKAHTAGAEVHLADQNRWAL